jgi:hypothetical protein
MNLTLKRVSGAPCRARVHLMEETVLEAVEQDPRSARVISQMCGSSKFTTDRITQACKTKLFNRCFDFDN